MMERTGPKISSCAMVILLSTSWLSSGELAKICEAMFNGTMISRTRRVAEVSSTIGVKDKVCL